MREQITIDEVITLFGLAVENRQETLRFYTTKKARDTALRESNDLSFYVSMELNINILHHKPVDILAVRASDGQYFRLEKIGVMHT